MIIGAGHHLTDLSGRIVRKHPLPSRLFLMCWGLAGPAVEDRYGVERGCRFVYWCLAQIDR